MNSLYGRFGMDDNHSELLILERSEFSSLLLEQTVNPPTKIIDINEFDQGEDKNYLVEVQHDDTNSRINSNFMIHNTSIGIAAAITAEARVHMSQFKNRNDIELYY